MRLDRVWREVHGDGNLSFLHPSANELKHRCLTVSQRYDPCWCGGHIAPERRLSSSRRNASDNYTLPSHTEYSLSNRFCSFVFHYVTSCAGAKSPLGIALFMVHWDCENSRLRDPCLPHYNKLKREYAGNQKVQYAQCGAQCARPAVARIQGPLPHRMRV